MDEYLFGTEKRIEKSWILEDEHYLATIVHPRLKHFQMAAPGDKEKAILLLKHSVQNRIASQMVSSSNLPCSSSQSHVNSSYSKSLEGKSLLARCFDQVSSPAPLYLLECEEYLNSTTTIDENHDDDRYWTQHQDRFPNIHSLARKVLAIPASNTEVERLFSCSKMAMTDNRTRLDADKLNKLIFLRKNLHSLKQLDEKAGDTRKRKSIDEYESSDEHEGEQQTPSVSKKHRTGNYTIVSSEDELKE
ncbi:unnamed protein product [Adineta steineri]|uniref:HAT C-terminal dimerisation domain-containing protein n=2 Tax=Adineta steineri TaxID=433720 RepID=A0A815P6V4_9BILA|nr:unnamed protein product [Adineta steineri]